MRRVIRQLAKGVGVFGLMVVAMVAFTGTALGASEGLFPGGDSENPTNAAPTITKRVRVPEGLSIPEQTYTFKFTSEAVQDKTSELSPDINASNTVTITYGAGDITPTNQDTDGYMYLERESANILADTTFSHAGIYVYTVVEDSTANSTSLNGGTMEYSTQKYRMRVYVDNTASGNDRYVKYVTFHAVTSDVVDPNEVLESNNGNKVKPVFTNTFTKDTSFLINKTVAGTYADKTLDFTYKLTLWNAPGATATSYDAEYTFINQDGTTGTRTETITANLTGATTPTTASFTLKHGEQLRFVNIPVGTKYTLTEAAAANYTASVTVSDGNAAIGTVTGAAKNTSVIIGDSATPTTVEKLKAPIVLTDRSDPVADHDNKAEWTNTYADPPSPTGIFMDNLPFIIMIVLAVTGFTGYIVMKRRSRRTE